MKIDPIVRLKDYIKSPSSPSWSSQGLKDMFSDLKGTMLDKQQIILPIIDDKFSAADPIMTKYQLNFIRDVTLHTRYPKSRVDFIREDLKWLLDRFEDKPTQHRAIIIALLLDKSQITEQEDYKIIKELKGSVAESFL